MSKSRFIQIKHSDVASADHMRWLYDAYINVEFVSEVFDPYTDSGGNNWCTIHMSNNREYKVPHHINDVMKWILGKA